METPIKHKWMTLVLAALAATFAVLVFAQAAPRHIPGPEWPDRV
jgi:hypothetical protein